MIFHHWAWNKIHLEMHKPEQRVFSTWPVYKFLARHHCLHHRHLDRNFNVVFPLADYVLGTRAGPTSGSKIYEAMGIMNRLTRNLFTGRNGTFLGVDFILAERTVSLLLDRR